MPNEYTSHEGRIWPVSSSVGHMCVTCGWGTASICAGPVPSRNTCKQVRLGRERGAAGRAALLDSRLASWRGAQVNLYKLYKLYKTYKGLNGAKTTGPALFGPRPPAPTVPTVAVDMCVAASVNVLLRPKSATLATNGTPRHESSGLISRPPVPLPPLPAPTPGALPELVRKVSCVPRPAPSAPA